MVDDHRVWPPEPGRPRHRRTPPEDAEPGDLADPVEERSIAPEPVPGPPPAWGRRGRPYADMAPPRRDPGRGRRAHPLDLGPSDGEQIEEPEWNPQIRRTVPRDSVPPRREREPDDQDDWDDALPPSARLQGSPAAPGAREAQQSGGRRPGRRTVIVLAALAAGTALVATTALLAPRLTAPPAATGRLSDALAGVTATLPQGWSAGVLPPVTGFTSVVRDGRGALVMARPAQGSVKDAKKATAQAAELYSRLLLKGDRVTVVEDRRLPDGHTRALRAEYQDVVNRPAFLRVTLVTRDTRPVLLVGLLQPEENARRQALDAVMTSLR
ncbi:hypothetical protein ACWEPC_22600 [Nonomuraea sp. NPDC004297]